MHYLHYLMISIDARIYIIIWLDLMALFRFSFLPLFEDLLRFIHLSQMLLYNT